MDGENAWKRVLATFRTVGSTPAQTAAFDEAKRAFLSDPARVGILKRELAGNHWQAALAAIKELPPDELTALFPELIAKARGHEGTLETVWGLILSLPREWVRARIEQEAEPALRTGDFYDYRCLLELYWRLDRDLAKRLAERAAHSPDNDIREAGHDYLEDRTS